jgi:hypothetical protein
MSDESGGNEVYLKAFPSGEGKWQVSTNGGAWPKWSRAGDEIIFRAGSEAGASMISVPVQTSPRLQLGAPVELFGAEDAPGISFRSGLARYDTTPDPDQLLMIELTDRSAGSTTRLIFAENWYSSYRNDGH